MYRTILLAYDGTTEGRLALREGARLAQMSRFNGKTARDRSTSWGHAAR